MSAALTYPRFALAERPGVITPFDTLQELVAVLVRAAAPGAAPKRNALSIAPCGSPEVLRIDGVGFVCGLGHDVDQLTRALDHARAQTLARAA